MTKHRAAAWPYLFPRVEHTGSEWTAERANVEERKKKSRESREKEKEKNWKIWKRKERGEENIGKHSEMTGSTAEENQTRLLEHKWARKNRWICPSSVLNEACSKIFFFEKSFSFILWGRILLIRTLVPGFCLAYQLEHTFQCLEKGSKVQRYHFGERNGFNIFTGLRICISREGEPKLAKWHILRTVLHFLELVCMICKCKVWKKITHDRTWSSHSHRFWKFTSFFFFSLLSQFLLAIFISEYPHFLAEDTARQENLPICSKEFLKYILFFISLLDCCSFILLFF